MSAPPPRPDPAAPPTLPDMARSYDAYFSSGLYHARYPRPNRRTMRFLRRYLPHGGSLLDFGAGEGRYCFALARERQASVMAVDVSQVARRRLTEAAASLGLAGQIRVCDADDAVYRSEVVDAHAFDVALLGFGVLGHIAGRRRRIEVLGELRSALRPEGRLVMGLPNALRRFRQAQADAAPRIANGELEVGDICYERHAGADAISLFYHLYRRDEIAADLKEAGFQVEHLTIESLLPERAVTHSRLLGALDDLASAWLPIDWAYGYLVVAKARG